MADGLDVVAVRVEGKSPEVIGGIVLAGGGGAIIAAAGGESRPVERLNGASVGCAEGDVDGAARLRTVTDPEKRLAVASKADVRIRAGIRGRQLFNSDDRKRRERFLVKGDRAVKVQNGDAKMVQHGPLPANRAGEAAIVRADRCQRASPPAYC